MRLEKIKINSLMRTFNQKFDIYICSSSFENRCLSVANNIDVDSIKQAIILSNTDLLEYVGDNKANLENIFNGKGHVVQLIQLLLLIA